MTITFENGNDVIVYALDKVISYARRTQQIFAANCVWWLASIIGLEQGLVVYIDNLQKRSNETTVGTSGLEVSITPRNIQGDSRARDESAPVTSRDLMNDRQADLVLDRAEQFIEDSERARNTWQRSRVNPLPQTKKQLKKARKIKRLQDSKRSAEALQNQRLQEIRNRVIQNLSPE